MVLDGPSHCALSVMTLIALAGPNGPRTARQIAAELDLPHARVNRALRDLTAARLLTIDLEPARVGYAATRPPSGITIAQIIEAAHTQQMSARRAGCDRTTSGTLENRAFNGHETTVEWARRGLLTALDQITLSDVLHAQFRRVSF
ncbi:Rrf2 family transcriptional regulator [Rhodovibrio salinarum]|uniref:Transcriptional regulator n=1 Tax=Rhodovibrio salinarum TaxID=1087 RepID=A0A934UYR1_9PROT|nr:Rrf2 family transcriptional regulator [Rhodovibrio salinarum]MBK1696058.1 transcriptional regulator [Rhodovibrio salinarum]